MGNLDNRIEEKRKKLLDLMKIEYNLSNEQIITLSQELDELIALRMKLEMDKIKKEKK